MRRFIGYIASSLAILITIIFAIIQLKSNQWEIQLNWWGMSVFVFPIFLYISYYFSKSNKFFSFVIAIVNDWLCWVVALIVCNYQKEFESWNDAESKLVTYIMIEIKLLISIIAIICYVIRTISDRVKLRELKGNESKNYNNYLYAQKMDYDKYLFFQHKKLLFTYFSKIQNKRIKSLKFSNIKFQINNEKIYYIKKGNLVESNLELNETRVIAADVSKFLVAQNEFYYTKETESGKSLFYKGMNTEENEICKNVEWFCVNKHGALVLKEKSLQSRIYNVIEITAQEFSEKNIALLQCENILHKAYLANEMIIIVDSTNVVSVFNLQTKEQQVIFAPSLGLHNINLICNENFIYLSVQEIKREGATIYDIINDTNGLYRIDIQTRESIKISDETYNEMYLFGGYIFGYKQLFSRRKKLYQISESGEVYSEIL